MQQTRSSTNQQLIPCRDGHNCSLQYNNPTEHNVRYSHPCCWSELCRDMNKSSEHARQFTHTRHTTVSCKYGGGQCDKLTDPEHRRTYRHEGLPDFLIPCRHKDQCRDRSTDHLQKFQHPTSSYQQTNSFKLDTTSEKSQSGFVQQACRYGYGCRDQSTDHLQKFQHPTSSYQQTNSFKLDTTSKKSQSGFVQQACRYGYGCRDQSDSSHCNRYSHPTAIISTTQVPTATTASSLHTCTGGNDMQQAYRIGGALALEKLSQPDQIAIQNMSADAIVVIPGTYDHIDRVLNSLNIKFTTVKQNDLLTYPFRANQTVYINCSADFPPAAAKRLRQHVENGLHIITTDWALKNVLEIAFSEFVRHNGQSTVDEVVGIQVVDGNHPLVNGFLPASKHAQPQWWLESSSHAIEIVNKNQVRVLIRSDVLGNKYQSDAVLVTFDCGKGNVIHMISHFYLQRSETRDARHQMSAGQYAIDSKASPASTKLVTNEGKNLNYAQIQTSSTSAQFIYNQIARRLNPNN